MSILLALAPTFGKGILVVVCAIILFVGSVYVLLTAVFGLRMGYLVLAVSFFGWMAIFSLIWTLGQPPILGLRGTPANEGPRGTEPHWQIFAAGTDALATKYPETASYPASPWRAPTAANKSSVDTTRTAVQKYLVAQASLQLEKKGVTVCKPDSSPFSSCYTFDPSTFVVQDVKFVTHGKTNLAAAHAFFQAGGPEVTVYAYHDPGDVQIYSVAFLLASLFGFAIHVPFLDRAERKRKAILTGGTAPPWFGPA